MKRCTLLLIFLLFAAPSYGVSLSELQKSAIANRHIIAQYQAGLDKSRSDVTMARSHFLPSVDISYTINRLDDDNLFEEQENGVSYGAVTWNLFSGFYDYYNIRSARLLERAQFHRLQGIKQDVQLNVALRYLDIFKLQSQREVAQESQATLQKLFEDSQNRYEVGLVEKNELLRFKVDLDNATITVKKVEAEFAKGVQRLAFETEQHIAPADLEFTEFAQLPLLDEPEEYQRMMLANRSELKTLDETNKAVGLQIKAARASYGPRLDVTGSYRRYENDYFPDDNTYDEELRGTAMLSLNLFDGFAKQAGISKAKSEKRNVAAQLGELQRGLETELSNLFLDYGVSLDTVAVSRTNILQAEENLRITRLKYQEGLEQESDLLDAISNLSLVKYIHVAARMEVFANYYRIIRSVEQF